MRRVAREALLHRRNDRLRALAEHLHDQLLVGVELLFFLLGHLRDLLVCREPVWQDLADRLQHDVAVEHPADCGRLELLRGSDIFCVGDTQFVFRAFVSVCERAWILDRSNARDSAFIGSAFGDS